MTECALLCSALQCSAAVCLRPILQVSNKYRAFAFYMQTVFGMISQALFTRFQMILFTLCLFCASCTGNRGAGKQVAAAPEQII